MENDKRHNGWKNYETWLVRTWLDNDADMERETSRRADVALVAGLNAPAFLSGIWTAEQAQRFTFADALKEWVSYDLCPDLGATFAADLLGAALSEVDWAEVAEHFMESARERAAVKP